MTGIQLNTDYEQERETFFADVILPVPVARLFTYRVPFELNDQTRTGQRVIVQFGKRKILTGVIGRIHDQPPTEYEAKYILEILEDEPLISDTQLKLYEWIAGYYMCTVGEVLNVALPAGLKLSSESRISLHPEFDPEETDYEFSDKENIVLRSLGSSKSLNYSEISQLLEQKNIHHILKSLVAKDAITIYEKVVDKYKPKKERRVRLKKEYVDSEKLQELFNDLDRYPGQVDILMHYVHRCDILENPERNETGILRSEFTSSKFSDSSLRTLIRNKFLEEFEVEVSRLESYEQTEYSIKLTPDQIDAKNQIHEFFEAKGTVLLHGVTGSGKTETYIELIREALDSGSQVLYLLPEIALTTQIVSRLKNVFGKDMGVYHSRFSDNERVEIWDKLNNDEISFIVGVRSSVFLPFDNLGLIIVDEEHEISYKQFDPAPRYNARDVALYIGKLHKAKVILGSATPSLESYYNCMTEKYGLVNLFKRFGEARMPDYVLVNTVRERKRKQMHDQFSSVLINTLQDTLEEGKQSIIFQNRRGYAPYLTCDECAWIPKCKHCAVSLTYHRYSEDLRCHYCGYRRKIPMICDACGSSGIKTVSFGTEKLEEELRTLFPEATIQRMDLDTTRKKKSYQYIINGFEKGEIDILVGTQMVSKGLDFDHVNLVGVFDIDRMMHFPDFRAFERTFQLITQVSGRSGRRKQKGKVIIQTANPEQPLIRKIVNHDYEDFYNTEINERRKYAYPPFVRLINVIVKNEKSDICKKAALTYGKELEQLFGRPMVIGPQEPIIPRIRNQYLWHMLIKIKKRGVDLDKLKNTLKETSLKLLKDRSFKGTSIIFDVDPL